MASPLVQALAFQNSVNPVPAAVAPTDVTGAYRLASDVAEKNYAAQLQRQNAFWGGLAGLGSAGMLAFRQPLSAKLFGSTAAATPGAAGATSPLAAATGTDAALAASPSGTTLAWPFATGAGGATTGLADAAGASGGLTGPMASLMAPAAGSIAGDFGLAGAGAAGAGGSIAADLGATGAADLGTTALADAGAASAPDWLAALFALA